MKSCVKIKTLIWFSFVTSHFLALNEAYASHSEGADITYKCLGGNQYELTVSFYRDCHGVAAPASATVNCWSSSANQNFDVQLQPIPGTGQEIPIGCSGVLTECNGGTYPGVQEWIYRTVVTLSPASDWIFSFDLCCRNAAITTIANPSNQNIHIESTLDNLNFPCNSSPVFSTKPIPFVCLNQSYTFNHGANDPDGDFITYELITPMNGFNSTVTYLSPYTAAQPLSTNPAMGFDTVTGDINMIPTMLEVTVVAVKVKQWRNNQLAGYVIRDIQLRSINCNNSYPYISGISGTWAYVTNACAGTNLTFDIYTYDPDTNQTVTLSWNNGIPGASFSVSAGPNSIGTFSWTPSINDTGIHCFTITVADDNCPINGKQTYSICIIVSGVEVNMVTTNANCGASNGAATATISGGTAPFTYHWLPCGCQNNPLNGLSAGTYTVIVTDAKGCTDVDIGTVNNGAAQGNVNIGFTPASCYGGNDGTATANANGGQPPYTYLWSNGNTTQTITGLTPGSYTVSVTTAQGCVKSDSVTITHPLPLAAYISQTDVLCFGGNSGSAFVSPSGATSPYTYQWNNGATTQTITGLTAGNYFVSVSDVNGCSIIQNVLISQPAQLGLSISAVNNVSCFGGNNGSISVDAVGGISPYTYLWNTNPVQTTQAATGLSAGNYSVSVTDNNGCTNIIFYTITEPPLITSTLSAVNANCFGSNTGFAAVSVAGGTPPYSYLWNPVAVAVPTAAGLFAGTYSVIITDMYGCSRIDSVTIAQPTLLSAAITNIQHLNCYNMHNGLATVTASGGTAPYSYFWSNGQGMPSAAELSSGNYTVTITDANGCTAVDTVTITQPNAILVSASPDDTICPGNMSVINASASGGTGAFTYFWQPNVGFGNSQHVSPVITTSYTVIITDANGCTGSGKTTVHVYSTAMNAAMNTPPSVCIGQSATLSALVSGNNITNYYWSNNLGTGAGPFIVYPSSTTTYSVIVTNLCGDTATATATILVHPLPQINLFPQTEVACQRVILQFSDTNSANNGSTYAWNFGDGSFSTQTDPSHTYTQTGVYTVNVVVTSPYGCSSSAHTNCTVEILTAPEADFTSDPSLETSIVNPYFHFFDASLNASSWSWDFGDGETSSLQNPVHTYAGTGIYTVKLIVLNAGMCVDSILRTIEVKPEFTFYLPNAFTPNGDHINDIFTGKGMEIIEFEMAIFDRWGEEIFTTNDLDDGWDGTVKGGGVIAQEDVYVYKVKLRDFEGTLHFYNGHVSLVK